MSNLVKLPTPFHIHTLTRCPVEYFSPHEVYELFKSKKITKPQWQGVQYFIMDNVSPIATPTLYGKLYWWNGEVAQERYDAGNIYGNDWHWHPDNILGRKNLHDTVINIKANEIEKFLKYKERLKNK